MGNGKKASSCLAADGWTPGLRGRHNALLTKWKLPSTKSQGETLATLQAKLSRRSRRGFTPPPAGWSDPIY